MSETTASAEAKDKKSRSKSQSDETSMNLDEIRELAELVNEHGFTEFEFENENIRVRLSKQAATQYIQAPQAYAPQPQAVAPQAAASITPSAATASESALAPASDLHKITSPIVGTFYRSPSPDKEPYVKEGSTVSPDTVVCIVEAMKLMNEIQAETSGEIVEIYAENGQAIEYGQPLFGIKK
jgi:acetyl-CoA carboxylase biotin carboxyl carrier protein